MVCEGLRILFQNDSFTIEVCLINRFPSSISDFISSSALGLSASTFSQDFLGGSLLHEVSHHSFATRVATVR